MYPIQKILFKLEQNFGLKRPFEYLSKFCYMQVSNMRDSNPPLPAPISAFLALEVCQ